MLEYHNTLNEIDSNDDIEKALVHLAAYCKAKKKLYFVTVHRTIFNYGVGRLSKTPNQIIKNSLTQKNTKVTAKIDLLILNRYYYDVFGCVDLAASKFFNNAHCDVVILKNA